MASEGKRTHENTSTSPKRIKLEKKPGEVTSGSSKQITNDEEDEEFTLDSKSDSEHEPSDSEDFSDDVEDDEGDGETTIVNGIQGECKESVEGKYSLHYVPSGREIKIVIDESHFKEAVAAIAERLKKNLIPVFQLTGSKSDSEEMILYAERLSVLDEEYPKSDGEHAHGALLRIENVDETFITTDFIENEV